jgi:GH35 family endo-1,4-beta-xylanase
MCKWQATHGTSRNEYSLDNCISSIKYAQSVNQKFRGHNLCWGNSNPKWLLDGNYNHSEAITILQEHVTTVMQGIKKATGRYI